MTATLQNTLFDFSQQYWSEQRLFFQNSLLLSERSFSYIRFFLRLWKCPCFSLFKDAIFNIGQADCIGKLQHFCGIALLLTSSLLALCSSSHPRKRRIRTTFLVFVTDCVMKSVRELSVNATHFLVDRCVSYSGCTIIDYMKL